MASTSSAERGFATRAYVPEAPETFDAVFQRRRLAFERCLQSPEIQENLGARARANPFTIRLVVCPCCGYPTLYRRAAYNICQLCNWEDDGQDDPPYGQFDPDKVLGGPNSDYSLTEARGNFARYGWQYREPDSRSGAVKDACQDVIRAFESLLPDVDPEGFRSEFNAIAALFDRLREIKFGRS
jgi:hypothetical protein